MFQYTKATLKAALIAWNTNANDEYEAELDDIIQRGELRLYRAMDLENLDAENDASTSATSSEVFKPESLVTERAMMINAGDGLLRKRSRAWVMMINLTAVPGVPRYYCELDDERWTVAPPADDVYLISIAGTFRPVSIVDGDDDESTWAGTRFPDMLFLACSIEATEFLKFWAHKKANETEFAAKLDDVLAIVKNLKRADYEDIIGNREVHQTPVTPPEPESTT